MSSSTVVAPGAQRPAELHLSSAGPVAPTAAPVGRPRPSAPTGAAVLERVRVLREVERSAAAGLLQEACRWADLHPALQDADALRCPETDQLLTPPGVPAVSHACVAELAAVLGLSTAAGQRLLLEALELRHRLPRLWARVGAGGVEAWRARSVARVTSGLGRAAAEFVDAQVSVLAGRVGPVQLERLVAAAVLRFHPDEAVRREREQSEQRRLRVLHPRSSGGLSWVDGALDLPDALDLDAALSAGARSLAEAGSTDSLDVRRARALGQLARSHLGGSCLPDVAAVVPGVTGATGTAGASRAAGAAGPGGSPPVASGAVGETGAAGGTGAPCSPQQPRHGSSGRPTAAPPGPVLLYVHLAADALTGADAGGHRGDPVARVGTTGTVVTTDQVRRWCGRSDARITVQPVLDLGRELTVEGYAVPRALREQVCLRDRTCVFPWCSRPAHPRPVGSRPPGKHPPRPGPTDLDHIIPYAAGGTTSSTNLAPLCRRHHQHKTHGGWRYLTLRPGSYLWTSPHRHRFLRDHTGTRAVPDTRSSLTGELGPGEVLGPGDELAPAAELASAGRLAPGGDQGPRAGLGTGGELAPHLARGPRRRRSPTQDAGPPARRARRGPAPAPPVPGEDEPAPF